MLVGSCQQIVSIYGGLHMQPIGISYTCFSQWYIHIHMYTPTCMKLNAYMQSYIYIICVCNISIHIFTMIPHTQTYIYIYTDIYSHHIIYHTIRHSLNGVSSLGLSVFWGDELRSTWCATPSNIWVSRRPLPGTTGVAGRRLTPRRLGGFLLVILMDFSHEEIGFLWDFEWWYASLLWF